MTTLTREQIIAHLVLDDWVPAWVEGWTADLFQLNTGRTLVCRPGSGNLVEDSAASYIPSVWEAVTDLLLHQAAKHLGMLGSYDA